MKNILKLWPVLLIILSFFSGYFFHSDNSEEADKKYQEERQRDQDAIEELQRRQAVKSLEFDGIKKRMKQDSAATAIKLQANQQAYNVLKKRYEEINLNMASSDQLDSIIAKLYP